MNFDGYIFWPRCERMSRYFFRQTLEALSQMTFLSQERYEFFNDIQHVRQAKLLGFHES